jgi:hypothetical protein
MSVHNQIAQQLQPLRSATNEEMLLELKHNVETNELASYTLECDQWDKDSRQLVFYRRNDSRPQFVDVKHRLYDALQFRLWEMLCFHPSSKRLARRSLSHCAVLTQRAVSRVVTE